MRTIRPVRNQLVAASLLVSMALLGLMGGCKSATLPTIAEAPVISEPMISAPTPQQPGKEVGISIDVSSAGGVTLNYTWNADGGEIVRGQSSPAITYRVPNEPGTYNIRVKVEWDGQSVEKVTSIEVEGEAMETPTTAPTPSSIIFRDDFDNSLVDGWNMVREDSTHWSLTDVPGSWRITLQAGGLGNGATLPANNLLLRQVPNDNFEIATLVNFTPTGNYQIAGLLIYQDDTNALQFGRAYCDAANGCTGNGIYFDNIQFGEMGDNFATVTSNPSKAYLRLRREGTTYTSYYSEDGINWVIIGQHVSNLNPAQVGLIAAQANEAETTADFEYFTIETLPY